MNQFLSLAASFFGENNPRREHFAAGVLYETSSQHRDFCSNPSSDSRRSPKQQYRQRRFPLSNNNECVTGDDRASTSTRTGRGQQYFAHNESHRKSVISFEASKMNDPTSFCASKIKARIVDATQRCEVAKVSEPLIPVSLSISANIETNAPLPEIPEKSQASLSTATQHFQSSQVDSNKKVENKQKKAQNEAPTKRQLQLYESSALPVASTTTPFSSSSNADEQKKQLSVGLATESFCDKNSTSPTKEQHKKKNLRRQSSPPTQPLSTNNNQQMEFATTKELDDDITKRHQELAAAASTILNSATTNTPHVIRTVSTKVENDAKEGGEGSGEKTSMNSQVVEEPHRDRITTTTLTTENNGDNVLHCSDKIMSSAATLLVDSPPLSIRIQCGQTRSSALSTKKVVVCRSASCTAEEAAAAAVLKKHRTQKHSSSTYFSPIKGRWIDNTSARDSVMLALTVFYAMVVTIFSLVLELSHLIAGDNRRTIGLKNFLFGLWMYGGSIVFLAYCYLALLLHPRWQCSFARLLCRIRGSEIQQQSTEADATTAVSSSVITTQRSDTTSHWNRKVSHDSPSAGSLFLRLGCVVFGVIGTVYYAFNVFLCFSDTNCQTMTAVLDVFAILFVFTQMHFVFCNWKLSISGARTSTCRFGTMHLIATNLWIWIRYILIEESVMDEEIRQVFARHANHKPTPVRSLPLLERSDLMNSTMPTLTTHFLSSELKVNGTMDIVHSISHDIAESGDSLPKRIAFTLTSSKSYEAAMRKCQGAECVLASMSEIMYTSIVEYSLIGAAVMFIVWRNIGRTQPISTDSSGSIVLKTYVRRKHQIRMDCSKSTTGLFFGLAFLAATFTSMAVFSGYMIMHQNQLAAQVFGSTDIFHYVVATIGCLIALWRMRILRYHSARDCRQCAQFRASSAGPPVLKRQSRSEVTLHSIGKLSTVTTCTPSFSTSTLSDCSMIGGTSAASGGGETCYSSHRSGNNPSQELLDKILLAFGMAGEMIYSVAGLLGLTGDSNSSWQPLTITLLVVHITRIAQVILQSCLIYIAGKLWVGNDPVLRQTQPGKQAITFLLLANISMFLMNLLEAEKAGVSETVVNFYGKKSWVFLVRSFSPLTIFYRFHSSVCLAEIWKSAYSWKD